MSTLAWSRLAPLTLLPGCLVSFNDYPVGDWSTAGSGGVANAGNASVAGQPAASGGSTLVPMAGSASGGSSGGGGGGGASTAGSGGSAPIDVGGTESQLGGSPDLGGGGEPPMQGEPSLIDDFEDGDDRILEQQGREGTWFVSNDGTGFQIPASGARVLPTPFMMPRAGSTRGLHTSGGPFETWGAIIGTSLASADDQALPYDLSGFHGIKLWVRSNSMSLSAAKEVRLNLPTPATTSGGPCTICEDHFGAPIPLTAKWVQVDVPFANLRQSGFGRPQHAKADLTVVTSLEFQFPENVSFDLWIDDIELY